MMTAKKQRKPYPKIGDILYRVDWVSKLAFYDDEKTEIDRDNCTESYRTFSTREAARKFAEEIWLTTTDKFGIAEVTQIEFQSYGDEQMPWAGSWQDVADAEIFSGEWES